MLSLIYITAVPAAATPVVFGVALMFGGLAQFVGGVIQLRMGNTFGGMLFCGFGAFWLSLFAIAQFFIKSVPPARSATLKACSCTRSASSPPSCSSRPSAPASSSSQPSRA